MPAIQIKNVSEELHRVLKARAAREGITLSELIARELPRIAEPADPMAKWHETIARIRTREAAAEVTSAADAVQAGRAEEQAKLARRYGIAPEDFD